MLKIKLKFSLGQEAKERLQAGKNKQTVVPCASRSIITCPSPRSGRYFRMYVGNLPAWAGSSTLKWFFNNYGEVVHAIVIHDKKSGRSWRFGFVTMTTMEKPDDAIARFEGEVSRLPPQSTSYTSCSVVLFSIP